MAHKIEWTDLTWNFVWGCKGSCSYCYAGKMAKRVGGIVAKINGLDKNETERLKNFEPMWLPVNSQKKLPSKPQKIFVNSMSDIAFWKPSWIYFLFEKMKEYPQHTFQILTKSPRKIVDLEFPDNSWIGITAESQLAWELRIGALKEISAKNKFVSFEPLLSPISDSCDFNHIDNIIIGLETGRKLKPLGKISRTDWISEIVSNIAVPRSIPVFVKTIEAYGRVVKNIDRFPEHLKRRDLMNI